MRPLSNPDYLNLFERGARLHRLDQSLLVLSAALPETPWDALADWPLGRRNRALIELHCTSFGPALHCWLTCIKCSTNLEFTLDGQAMAHQASTDEIAAGEPVVVAGHAFRLPTSRDLARLLREAGAEAAVPVLFQSCRLDAGEPLEFSEDFLEEVGDTLARADPLAETRVTFQCPDCGSDWQDTLEIADFVWAEIEARARRLLREIHAIASAYGWSEGEILSLSHSRRALYLEMVNA